jgi:hypothetical protein
VIIVESEVAKIPHRFRERIDGAMLFLEKDRHRARSVAAKAAEDAKHRREAGGGLGSAWRYLSGCRSPCRV